MPILSRRQLYDLVWATPLRKLAEDFGISDVGLAKLCERHRVPTPPRGFWAKKAAGQRVKQSIFVQIDDPRINNIDINGRAELPEPVRLIIERRRTDQRPNSAAKPRQTFRPMAMAVDAVNLHPSIRDAALALRARRDAPGKGNHWDNLRIAPESRERVITFLDQLARGCEKNCIVISVKSDRFCATIGSDDVHFIIQEKTKQVLHVQTKEQIIERKLRSSSSDSFDWFPAPTPQFDIAWTGQLGVHAYGYGSGLRQTWNDGKTQTIESMLPDIIVGMEAHIAARKIHNDRIREREAEREELRRRHALAEARSDREKARQRLLKNQIRTEKMIIELRAWLAKQEALLSEDRPYTARMVHWVQERLKNLENFVEPNALEIQIRDSNTFPEIDELLD